MADQAIKTEISIKTEDPTKSNPGNCDKETWNLDISLKVVIKFFNERWGKCRHNFSTLKQFISLLFLDQPSTALASTLSPEKKAKFGFPASQAQNYTVGDCRALVKTLVCGVKTITWGLTSTKAESNPALGGAAAVLPNSQFQPKETLVYIRLVKWAMEVRTVSFLIKKI